MARRGLIAAFLVLGLFVPHTVCARSASSQYSMQVEDEWGRELSTFQKGSTTYVLGSLGQRYLIRLQNFSGVRVEAVVTVDGRDVVSGRSGDFVSERGYLLEPYGELVIEGFRRSHDDVAAFRFSSPGESYSSRMGTPENVGIIGAAFFPERSVSRAYSPARSVKPQPRASAPRTRSGLGTSSGPRASAADSESAPAKAASGRSRPSAESSGQAYRDEALSQPYASAQRKDNLGTEYGESVRSHVREVAFIRASPRSPATVFTVRYDDERGLEARGIRVHPYRPIARATPAAFPHNRFAPPPP